LNVRVHGASRPAANRALAQLFDHLNNAQVKYPGTELQMIFELGSLTPQIMPKVSDSFPRNAVS
jgi:hypothetical protein